MSIGDKTAEVMTGFIDDMWEAAPALAAVGLGADLTLFGGEATGSLLGAAGAGAEALSGSLNAWQGW